MKNSKSTHKLAAVATLGMMTASGSAMAATATTFRDMSNNMVSASGGFQNLI